MLKMKTIRASFERIRAWVLGNKEMAMPLLLMGVVGMMFVPFATTMAMAVIFGAVCIRTKGKDSAG
jgi:hypothetical protein